MVKVNFNLIYISVTVHQLYKSPFLRQGFFYSAINAILHERIFTDDILTLAYLIFYDLTQCFQTNISNSNMGYNIRYVLILM